MMRKCIIGYGIVLNSEQLETLFKEIKIHKALDEYDFLNESSMEESFQRLGFEIFIRKSQYKHRALVCIRNKYICVNKKNNLNGQILLKNLRLLPEDRRKMQKLLEKIDIELDPLLVYFLV